MPVNVKMGADIQGFTSGIKEGQQVLKGLNAEMKASEAEFKATGNAQQKLEKQTSTLNKQIEQQKKVAEQARAALEALTRNGVKETDAEYQKLYVTMMQAEAGASEAQAALNALGGSAAQAATQADQLSSSMNGISKKISLDQVISGVDRITSGLERAAQKAVDLGQKLWDTIMDSARRADDTATMAEMYGIDIEKFQQMQKLVANGMDTSVESMLASQKKLRKGVGNKSLADELNEIGVAMNEWQTVAGQSGPALRMRDSTELFWEAGQALMNLGDEYDKEAKAQAIFGRSWEELRPLFNTYKSLDEYNAALEKQTVNSEETVRDLAALNDAVGALESSWQTLKDELIGALSPALSGAATALGGLLDSLTAYLKTPEGKKLITDLGTAVSGLFEDLGKIDPEEVVTNFSAVFTTLTDGMKWITENQDTVVGALEAIVAGWAALKITGGILDIVKIVQGIGGLTTTGAATAGAAAGASWASSFAAAASSAITSIAPWLATTLGVTAVALTPALLAQADAKRQWTNTYNERAAVAAMGGKNAWFIDAANNAFGMDGQTQRSTVEALLMGLKDRQNQEKAELYNLLSGRFTSEAGNTWNALNAFWGGGEMDPAQVNAMLQDITNAFAESDQNPKVTVEPEVAPDAASQVAAQVGTVTLPARLALSSFGNSLASFFGIGSHANGIWSVPRDNYLAYLHKGERVVPAREVGSRSYSSNLYVESMVMNNGASAEGLAAAMAAAQRRTMSGYGS